MQTRSFITLMLPLTLGTALLTGCAGGLAHKNLVPPEPRGNVTGIEALGTLTSMKLAGDKLYLAGQKGIAAFSRDGKPLWTSKLDEVAVRLVEVEGEKIAYSQYNLGGVEGGDGFAKFFMGQLSNEVKYTGLALGLLDGQGKKIWEVSHTGEFALSRPAFGPDALAIADASRMYLYGLQDGQQQFKENFLKINWAAGLLKGMNSQTVPIQPTFTNGNYYGAGIGTLLKVLGTKRKIDKDIGYNLFNTYDNITAGPSIFGENVVIGSTPNRNLSGSANKQSQVYAYDKKGKTDWRAVIKDVSSGVGSQFVYGKVLYAATNFDIAAFDEDGDVIWKKVNGKGGLYPGTHRGVRFSGNIAFKRSPGNQLAVNSQKVFITSNCHDETDVITVLDAKKGDYIKSININKPILELAADEDNLYIMTLSGLDIVSAK